MIWHTPKGVCAIDTYPCDRCDGACLSRHHILWDQWHTGDQSTHLTVNLGCDRRPKLHRSSSHPWRWQKCGRPNARLRLGSKVQSGGHRSTDSSRSHNVEPTLIRWEHVGRLQTRPAYDPSPRRRAARGHARPAFPADQCPATLGARLHPPALDACRSTGRNRGVGFLRDQNRALIKLVGEMKREIKRLKLKHTAR